MPHVLSGRSGYGSDVDLFDYLVGQIRERFNDNSIYITADHGNVCATGKGEPKEGVLVEQRGKRSRVYDNPTFVKRAAKAFPESIRWSDEYLTPKYPVLIADGLTAFAREGEKVVAHGGISVEEVLVPFIQVSRGE